MEGEVFDNVKYEKAKAIARFNRFRKFAKLWQVFEVVVVLLLLSWWSKSMPAALKLSGEFLLRVSACVFKPHVVFLIGNAIIVALFVLCKQNGAGNTSSGGISGDGDLYDEYVRHREAQKPLVSASEEEKSEVLDRSEVVEEEEKRLQIVVAEPPERQCDVPVEPAVVQAEEQIRRFQRTQSERLRGENAVRPQRELRRSETEFRRRVTSSSFDTVDALTNEEFKLTVDAFIHKHQRFFKEQKRAELEGLKCNY